MMAIGIIFVWYGLLKAEKSLYITTGQYFQKPNFLREKRFLVYTAVMLWLCCTE